MHERDVVADEQYMYYAERSLHGTNDIELHVTRGNERQFGQRILCQWLYRKLFGFML